MLLVSVSREELHTLLVDTVSSVFRRLDTIESSKTEQPPSPDQYLSKKEAAELLSCSTSTIDNHARAGRLTRYYVGKIVRFRRDEVLALAQVRQYRQPGEPYQQ